MMKNEEIDMMMTFEQIRLLLIKRRWDWEELSSSLPCPNEKKN